MCDGTKAQVRGGKLIENLPQRSHPAQQVTDDRIGLGRVGYVAGRVGETTQRRTRLGGVQDRVVEGRHERVPSMAVGLRLPVRCATAHLVRSSGTAAGRPR